MGPQRFFHKLLRYWSLKSIGWSLSWVHLMPLHPPKSSYVECFHQRPSLLGESQFCQLGKTHETLTNKLWSLFIRSHSVTDTHWATNTHAHTCLLLMSHLCRATALGHLPCPLKCPLTGAALIKTESGNAVVEPAEGGGNHLGQNLFGQNSSCFRHLILF